MSRFEFKRGDFDIHHGSDTGKDMLSPELAAERANELLSEVLKGKVVVDAKEWEETKNGYNRFVEAVGELEFLRRLKAEVDAAPVAVGNLEYGEWNSQPA